MSLIYNHWIYNKVNSLTFISFILRLLFHDTGSSIRPVILFFRIATHDFSFLPSAIIVGIFQRHYTICNNDVQG